MASAKSAERVQARCSGEASQCARHSNRCVRDEAKERAREKRKQERERDQPTSGHLLAAFLLMLLLSLLQQQRLQQHSHWAPVAVCCNDQMCRQGRKIECCGTATDTQAASERGKVYHCVRHTHKSGGESRGRRVEAASIWGKKRNSLALSLSHTERVSLPESGEREGEKRQE